MPLQRMQMMVAMMLTAAPMVPNPDDDERQCPVVRAVPAGKGPFAQRRIRPPGNIGRAARPLQPDSTDKAVVHQQSAQRGHPEAEGIQPRESHVPCADHQRHEVIGESNDQRHPHEEHHGGAMHGEDAVENLGGEKVIIRYGELNAQQQAPRRPRPPERSRRMRCTSCRASCGRR